MSTVWLILTIIIMLGGIIGSILPIIPGTLLMGLAVFWYGWIDGFVNLHWGWAMFLILVSLFAGTADVWLPLMGAKSGGASPRSILWGILGSVIGFIAGSVIPVLGSLIGALVGYLGGIYLSEFQRLQDSKQSLKAVIGGVAGWGLATVVQFGASVFILIVFLIVVL
jgi:uncharacterized protein YqgC (DUF456 family)